MTNNTLPESLRLANELEAEFAQGRISNHTGRKAATELRRQHTRIAELEAQLESIGAGGVSGPLMGCASIAASAGSEPVALDHIACIEDGELRYMTGRKAPSYDCELYAMPGGKSAPPLYTNPSPPEGMVGGWMPIETAPKHESVLLYSGGFVPIYCGRKRYGLFVGEPQQDALAWRCDSSGMFANPTHWMPLPLPPTTSAGSGKGE